MVDYAKKFGISEKVVKKWSSDSIYLEGTKDTLVILIPGWSAVTRQTLPLAKQLNKNGWAVKCLKLSGHGTIPEDLKEVNWNDWINDVVIEIKKLRKCGKFSNIIVGGISMGGNVGLLASLREKVDGIILIGTPVHLKGFLAIKFFSIVTPLFKKYTKKVRPRNIYFAERDSYQYFPVKNMREVLKIVKESVKSLKKITAPILILQAKNDFFVTKYSPWIIYKNVSSEMRKMCWIHTDSENHVPQKGVEVDKAAKIMQEFVKKITE